MDVVSGTGNGSEYFGFSQTNGNGVGASIGVEEFSGDSLILVGKNVAMNATNTWTATGSDIHARGREKQPQSG